MGLMDDIFTLVILIITIIESIIFLIFILLNYDKIRSGDLSFIPILLLFIAVPSILTFVKAFCEGMGGKGI